MREFIGRFEMRRLWLGFLSLSVLAFFFGAAGVVEARDWKLDTEIELSYVNNVYKLSSSQQDRLDEDRASDKISGRYDDMDSIEDILVTPAIKAEWKIKRPGHRDLSLTPALKYKFYTQNTKKSYLQLGFDLEQEVATHDSVVLSLDYAHDVFKKNYLAETTDQTGNVSSSEKIYQEANYNEVEAGLAYNRRLWKGDKASGSPVKRIDGEFSVGYRNRTFDSPFSNRDEDGYLFGSELDVKLRNSVDLSFGYDYEYITAPNNSEVMVRTESDFGTDFNNDGDAVDVDRRTVQKVDRTRSMHTISLGAGTSLGMGWHGEANYDIRFENFKSKERYDITRKNRNDVRHRIGFGVEKEFAKDWIFKTEGRWTYEKADRGGMATVDSAESKSYDILLLAVSVSREF